MFKDLSLILMLAFMVIWISYMIFSIRIIWINRKIKKLVKKEFPNIRYEFGVNPKYTSTYRMPRMHRELLLTYLKFGSSKSVKSYFEVFMDFEGIYNTKHSQLINYMNQMFVSQKFAIQCLWGMFIDVGLVFLFNWLK